VNIRNDALTRLLTLTKRPQTVAGKKQDQVESTLLRFGGVCVETINIVRDGVTSLSRFSTPHKLPMAVNIPIASIDAVLGILPYHGTEVSLSWSYDKLEIRSRNKKTTLTSSLNAPAFANCPDAISVWAEKSLSRFDQLREDGAYLITSTGEWLLPKLSITLDSSELFEALRCDAINGQKTNRFTFAYDADYMSVKVGSELKGATETIFSLPDQMLDAGEVTIEGGIDSVLKHYGGDVTLHFLDFSEYEQGTRILFVFPNGDMVFQVGLLE
jgi:hypothetical protein